MEQLREEGINYLRDLQTAWSKELRRCSKEGEEFDLYAIQEYYAELVNKFNKSVQECKLRGQKAGKKGIFG